MDDENTGIVTEFARRILGPSADQAGQILGDYARLWRVRNLVSISRKFERIRCDWGIDLSTANRLKLAVGLPLLEKASYQDDSYLQERWAHLIASVLRFEDPGGVPFSLDIAHIEALHQFSRLDCEVLEFVVENEVRGQDDEGPIILARQLEPETIDAAFPKSLSHISLEKLESLGCIRRNPKLPLKSGGSGTLKEIITPTLIGINLYVSASGKNPDWLREKNG